jgi:hypothetical protein
VKGLAKNGITAVTATPSLAEASTRARAACAAQAAADNARVYIGTLSTQTVGFAAMHGTSAIYDLTTYDCRGNQVAHDREETDATGKDNGASAIEKAVDAALAAILHPGHHRR